MPGTLDVGVPLGGKTVGVPLGEETVVVVVGVLVVGVVVGVTTTCGVAFHEKRSPTPLVSPDTRSDAPE
ncbi:MAG: hypothetical protein V9G04_02340 [Nocardioides sp.]